MTVPATMPAMVLERPGRPLMLAERTVPAPAPNQILIAVSACGVCRTDLHIFDGELPQPKLPLILGHEIVGRVAALGEAAEDFAVGDRVGVPWLGGTDGTCRYCRLGQENLCDDPRFTGYHIDGGYAGYTVADARYAFKLPEAYSDAEAAPLLCAGLIGYRSLKLAGARPPGSFRDWASTASAPRPISWRKWRRRKGAKSMPSRSQGTARRRISPARLARCGPEAPTKPHRKRLMPPSSSRLSARWCRPLSKRSAKAASWYAAASI